jgi:transcriptional regulator with XRE-family HTH domain
MGTIEGKGLFPLVTKRQTKYSPFGALMVELCTKKGLTLHDLAASTGLSYDWLRSIRLNGLSLAPESIVTTNKIAAALDADPEEFYARLNADLSSIVALPLELKSFINFVVYKLNQGKRTPYDVGDPPSFDDLVNEFKRRGTKAG